jgi:23S rRNA (adenine2503-C2)-methyltransferase
VDPSASPVVPAAPGPRVPAWDLCADDLAALGYRRRASHLFGQLQRLKTWSAEGPVLSREARALAEASLDLSLPAVVEEVPSEDGSTRLVLALADGARVEAVHMPRALRQPRVTVCLSSQVGCAMGCSFCATAQMGLVRDLAAHEIIGQLFAVLRRFGPRSAESLNLVFMGMGEPLHNVEAIVRTLDVLCDPTGLGVAARRITVSTAGHVAGLERLARARYLPELAISVNAATDELRQHLMPIGKRWPLRELRAALDRWPKRPHGKLTLEYVLLDGVNDDLASADRLAAWIGDLRHLLDVIPFNAWGRGPSPYRAPTEARVQAFVARLHERGCLVTVRRTRGRDVRAACGTLITAG